MKKIAGVIVLYHPDHSVIDKIQSFIDCISILYAIDNSEQKDHKIITLLQNNPKILYIDNNGNQGIAHALNVGAKRAIAEGFHWLLTMDQDSSFINDSLNRMIFWLENNDISQIGIISSIHVTSESKVYEMFPSKEVLSVMTSGNLLNLTVFKKVGDFKEEFFIDYVDHEYCLRLNKHNYRVLVIGSANLQHRLGDTKINKLLWKTIKYTNHNYIRRYYITRNRLHVIWNYFHMYPFWCMNEIKAMFFEGIKIILFENDKIKKIRSILIGIFDFVSNRYGKV
jgi:rhamnosyltransferase